MSIRLEGTLVVRHINGKNGGFAVGDLTTAIGKFKVKDAILDQYEEGEYKGSFLVTQIFPSTYVWGGRVVTEIRVNVSDVFLDEAEEKAVPAAPFEPDPVNEEQVAHSVDQTSNPADEQLENPGDTDDAIASDGIDDPDATLFGAELHALVTAGKEIKLDPTIDRGQFRKQRDRLKVLGYEFRSASQTWFPRA